MHIRNGWTWDSHAGTLCKFVHHDIDDVKRRARFREELFVVETVNWTFGENDGICHLNQYFAVGLGSAIALAATIEINSREVAEEVLSIRLAAEDEAAAYSVLSEHFEADLSPAMSDRAAQALIAKHKRPTAQRVSKGRRKRARSKGAA